VFAGAVGGGAVDAAGVGLGADAAVGCCVAGASLLLVREAAPEDAQYALMVAQLGL
jgi:hypothetical protein